MTEDMVDVARSEGVKDLVKGSKAASLLELDDVAVRDQVVRLRDNQAVGRAALRSRKGQRENGTESRQTHIGVCTKGGKVCAV